MAGLKDVDKGTRRGTLIYLQDALEDEEKLKEVAGQNVLVDACLILLAEHNDDLFTRLAKYMSVTELTEDIEHVARSYGIRNRRKYIEGIYGQSTVAVS